MSQINFYEILGCKPIDNFLVIKKAYRKKVKSAHPDNDGLTERFVLIQEAKEILLNKEKRIDYDFSFTNISTKLIHKQISINVNINQILGKDYVFIKYIRKIACECKSNDKDCTYCCGEGIRDDEVDLTLKDIYRQKDKSLIVFPNGGDMDRYGRTGDLHIIINYDLAVGFEIDQKTKWFMTYNFKIKDYELLDCFNFTNKSFILKTKELGSLTLNSRVFNKKEKVMINERINVYVSIEITDIDLLLQSNYFTELKKQNL
jgi:curved DNA-binding protein CbpA